MIRLLEGKTKEELLKLVVFGDILEYVEEDHVIDFAEKYLNLVHKDIAIEELCDDKSKLNNIRKCLGFNNLASVDMIIEELKKLDENGYR